MIGFSKSLAQEIATRNITVNCVAPGFIETAMTDKLNDKQKEAIMAAIPAGPAGTGAEVASAVVYLASDEAGLRDRPDAPCQRRHGDDLSVTAVPAALRPWTPANFV